MLGKLGRSTKVLLLSLYITGVGSCSVGIGAQGDPFDWAKFGGAFGVALVLLAAIIGAAEYFDDELE